MRIRRPYLGWSRLSPVPSSRATTSPGKGASMSSPLPSPHSAQRPSGVFSRWKGQEMKAMYRPPPSRAKSEMLSSCQRRTSSMWWIRSATPSMCPNIIVAEVLSPNSWATRITVNQDSASHLPSPILRRTASAKISPPPPGTDCSPASTSVFITPRSLSASVAPGGSKKSMNSMNSGGLNAWTWTCGNRSVIEDRSSTYQSSGSSGFMPPCMRIWVPPISTSSLTLVRSVSYSRV